MTKAFIVGAGPGDPDLLTIRALKALKQADVVLYDRLVSNEILALAHPDAELIDVGKSSGEQEVKQRKIFDYFDEYADSGKAILRLKGGDPYIFGRGYEEHVYLLHKGYEVELVPGITSAVAVPGLAGIPLTVRGLSRSFAVVTGHCCSGCGVDWPKYAQIDTLVLLMAVGQRESIAQALIASGRKESEPVAFIENGTLPNERIVRGTLKEVANGRVDVTGPAIFIVGEVAALEFDARRSYEDYKFVSRNEEERRLRIA